MSETSLIKEGIDTNHRDLEHDTFKEEVSVRFVNTKVIKSIFETLSAIIDETSILFSRDGISITAMDPSRICLLKLKISKDSKLIDELKCTRSHDVVINLDDLDKIMKRAASNDELTFSFLEEENKLKIIMKRKETSRTRKFSLALLDSEIEEIPMNNLLQLEYNSDFTIEPSFLIEAIKDAEIYSEILNINMRKDGSLIFSSSGQIGEMVYNLSESDLIDSTFDGNDISDYSITFLKNILKLNPITEKLKICLKTDHPIRIDFDLEEGVKLNYFLAPRVEEEEFEDDDDINEF